MSKTNTEKMAPETQTPEMANGMKLDVRVRPIAPMGNLLAFANVTIGGCFKIDGFRICSSEKGLYVNMPATQDKGGNWKDVCWPVTAEFRKQLNDALIDGYGQAIENLQATLEATKGAAEKPSLSERGDFDRTRCKAAAYGTAGRVFEGSCGYAGCTEHRQHLRVAGIFGTPLLSEG